MKQIKNIMLLSDLLQNRREGGADGERAGQPPSLTKQLKKGDYHAYVQKKPRR
jgi:hypothetical protein